MDPLIALALSLVILLLRIDPPTPA